MLKRIYNFFRGESHDTIEQEVKYAIDQKFLKLTTVVYRKRRYKRKNEPTKIDLRLGQNYPDFEQQLPIATFLSLKRVSLLSLFIMYICNAFMSKYIALHVSNIHGL